ncbi:mRNA 3'-end-processing protein rna14 [Tilletia horrida]|nr:mRNA 3'-end-processing protein rna14 [Tilletia horrida]
MADSANPDSIPVKSEADATPQQLTNGESITGNDTAPGQDAVMTEAQTEHSEASAPPIKQEDQTAPINETKDAPGTNGNEQVKQEPATSVVPMETTLSISSDSSASAPTNATAPTPIHAAPAATGAASASASVSIPAPAASNPKQLAGEELYRAQLVEEARDPETWLKLLDAVLTRGDLEEIRKTYDDFFRVFPTAASQWVAYLDLELAHSNFSQVESIFARCLRNTPSMELWRFYLSYTRRVNPLPPITGSSDASEETPREKTRKIIEAAYEFCLGYIGREKDSGNIWMEYIHFIKEREVRVAYKEGQKMDDLRRVYHRALSIPLNNIELIWRDYDQWESSLNKVTAKKFLGDRSAAYMTARSALREMHGLADHLHRPGLPKLPAWSATHLAKTSHYDSDRDRELVEDWKKYLAWEAKNPLVLDDPAALQARVLGAYKRAMMTMRFYPEIWYSASSYCASIHKSEEAVEWLRNGMEACPGSFLLTFAFVDLQESRRQTSECSAKLDVLLQDVHSKIEARQAKVTDACAAIDAEGEAARAAAIEAKRKTGAVEDVAGEEREMERQQEEKRTARKTAIEEAARPAIDELKESAALIWIKHMQFLRRTEIWEANALLEYHCSKDKGVATKVFELALKTFGGDEAFVTRYLEFLITINDDSNARALLERVIPTFPPERARPIWDRWAEYEYAFGDLESIQKMETRLAETYPDEPPIKRFLDRNTYMDLDVISVKDLGYRPQIPGANAAERAVAATKDLAEDPHQLNGAGRRGRGEDEDGPSLKRPRLARDSASPAPAGGAGDRKVSGAAGPDGKGKAKKNGSPRPEARLGIVERPNAITVPIPEPVLFFMDILPRVDLFDGPKLNEHDMIDCILNMNVPLPPPSAPAAMTAAAARGGIRGRKRGGFGRRY